MIISADLTNNKLVTLLLCTSYEKHTIVYDSDGIKS